MENSNDFKSEIFSERKEEGLEMEKFVEVLLNIKFTYLTKV